MKCVCFDLITKTLAADNETNWFHKSPREQIACYEPRQRDFSKIRREEFCTASFLSCHLFNLSPSFLSKAAPKQKANKAGDLHGHCSPASHKWARLFSAPRSNCMHNGTDGEHSFDNVCICVCWRTRSIVSFKKTNKKKTTHGPVENVLTWVISDCLTLGIIYHGWGGAGGAI